MADSDYDFILTRNEIIQEAYDAVIGAEDGETLTGAQISRGVKKLNTLLKAWSRRNYKIWQRYTTTLALTAGEREYDAPSDPRIAGILVATYRYKSGRTADLNLEVWGYPKYQEEYTKEGDQREPIAVSYDQNTEKIYVYPEPKGDYTLDMVYIQENQDMDTATGTGTTPAEGQLALIYGLALELAPAYGVTLGERDALEKRLNKELKELKKSNRDITSGDQCRGYYD